MKKHLLALSSGLVALALAFGIGVGIAQSAHAVPCCQIICEPPTYYSWVLGKPFGTFCVKDWPNGQCYDVRECGPEI